MEKIYGYKENDIIGLAEFIKERKNEPLSQVFERYASISNKAKGTVRNLYYALAKLSVKDKKFCAQHLDGKPIKVEKIIEFDKEHERFILKQILLGKKEGKSVRSVIMQLAKGDGKLALRYQNKFRNAVKFNPDLISKIIVEIKATDDILSKNERNSANGIQINDTILEFSMDKIKKEISGLIIKNNYRTRKENDKLRARVLELEEENAKLNKLLLGENNSQSMLRIFHRATSKSLQS